MTERIVGMTFAVLCIAGCIGAPGPEEEIDANEMAVCSAPPVEPVSISEEPKAESGSAAVVQDWHICACPLHTPACNDCEAATSRDECLAGICENEAGASLACRWMRWSPFPGPY